MTHQKRVESVVSDMVDAIRGVLRKHEVSFDEYRAGVRHLMAVAESGETPLLLDVFFNSTIVAIEDRSNRGSKMGLEGPYFLENAPEVDGELKKLDGDEKNSPPLVVQGRIADLHGAPVADAVLDIWHSTPDGRYGGYHDNLPKDIYRGKIRTDANGGYRVRSLRPVAYHIPNKGPTGALLEKHMGRHSWRPAHVHFKIRKDGYKPLTTQAYFEGGDWNDSDCCSGVWSEQIHRERVDDGVHVLEIDFVLDSAP